ncbi:MAG: class I SAM-dependent methyltransferase [Thermodesulfobacteriota bacterium]
MEKEEGKREEGLKAFILTQIEERGPVPFARFMEWCLYHPTYGYYTSERIRIGKDGDYYTSSCVHPLFGHLIAKQLFQMAEILGGNVFDVIEMGGGRGFLCHDILDWSERNSPSFYERLRYDLIEMAPSLLGEQKERLSKWQKEGKVSWVPLEDFEAGRFQGEGCFLSNELVDAFPVHRIVFDDGKIKESHVTHQQGQWVEQWDELSDPRIADYLQSMNIRLEDGQKAEVNLKALDWMEKVGRCLKKGFVLTIDYGYVAEELYSPYRREGTLLCYHRHQTSERFFERLGEQDITSHVNFTGLICKGEEVGLHFTGLVPQYQFLIGLGLLREMGSLEGELSEIEALRLRLTLKHLIEPEAGMGEIFKVLVQHKGIKNPRLDGLRELREITV